MGHRTEPSHFVSGVVVLLLVSTEVIAHKPVTSKYTYDSDVFPILRDHCSRCHVPGGAAPMSLMNYKEAVSWADSIRSELTSGRMPPWPVDFASPMVKGGDPLSAKNTDIILTWASGGTPPGDLAFAPADLAFVPRWDLGVPDLLIPMTSSHTVVSTVLDEVCNFSLTTGLNDVRWVRAVDLLPGTPSIVRDATITDDDGSVLRLWQPGARTIPTSSGAAFRLGPGSAIHLQIHYKKHFDQEQESISDKSTIGVYFADASASVRPITSFVLDSFTQTPTPDQSEHFERSLPFDGEVIAVRPMLNRPYDLLRVDAITPHRQIPLLVIRGARPQWQRRYWLERAVELPHGSRIQVRATPLVADADEPKVAPGSPLRVALDVVSP